MRNLSFFSIGLAMAALSWAGPAPAPTFSKDVAPILQNHCQECHRPGEAAPMSLLNYQQARPWAKAIKSAVLSQKMPPWGADPSVGHFSNDRSLSLRDRDTLVAWVDAGAPEGDSQYLPKPVEFVDGWNIGQPDVVYEMPEAFQVPASGTIEYQYVILPYQFPEDRWVQMAEAKPGVASVVHHVVIYILKAGETRMTSFSVLVGWAPGDLGLVCP
ncbi:MAG TPA: cytochrome c, partial [Candidatus Methylomirabilis sp.]|nr:cytochrome c [Candidatus Methylomirabilis sp.]